jgi:uncharacterized protein YecE (DUF72 family)
MPVLIGTSGWQYRDWRGGLYPPGLPQRRWLEHYASHYQTVENNNSFYRLPPAQTFAGWRARTPDDFIMTVKASRYLSHIKRLQDPEDSVKMLMERARALGSHLGPILVQLPPGFRAEPERLDATLRAFGPHVRVAVEPRHDSWFVDDVRAVLERHGAALCLADRGSRPITPMWRTADWGYVRLHFGRAQPPSCYGRDALAHWVERIEGCFDDNDDVFVFFNNDGNGCAVRDAVVFATLARERGLDATRVPDLDEAPVG